MRKMKLEIDALRVDTFDTTAIVRRNPGTVRAHADANDDELIAITTPQTQERSCWGTCKLSCWGTCEASCNGTCEVSCDGRCTELCSYGCSDGCTYRTCPSGAEICCA
jgi:hypothetical protein